MSTPPGIRDRRDLSGLPLAAWAIGGIAVLVLLVLAGAYGFHRDEMYFILAGRHPDFGYVDQPPLTPLLSAAAAQLLGATPFAVRILPAVATGVCIVLGADMAREFGASPRGQVLAALLLAISGLVGVGHLDETATFDVLFWTVATWLMVGLLASAAPSREWRRWLALGLVMGIALENKTLPLFLGASLAGGVLLARRSDIVRSPGLWAAIAIAIAIWVPNVVWQATHGYPQIEMAGKIASENQGLGDRVEQVFILLIGSGPFVFPVFLAGLVWLIRSPDARAWRALGLGAVILFVLMFVTAGKSYYSVGFIPVLMAAGAGPLDRWLGRAWLKWSVFAPAASVSAAMIALLMLPLVPPGSLHSTPIPDIYAESVAQIGWPELATQVRGVVDRLPASDRAHAVIITAAYGQYGGLAFYGTDLPPIFSGHNSVWYWGRPGDGAGPVILVGNWSNPPPSVFAGCSIAATVDNGLDLPTEEQGTPIWVCRGTSMPWAQAWPLLKHID